VRTSPSKVCGGWGGGEGEKATVRVMPVIHPNSASRVRLRVLHPSPIAVCGVRVVTTYPSACLPLPSPPLPSSSSPFHRSPQNNSFSAPWATLRARVPATLPSAKSSSRASASCSGFLANRPRATRPPRIRSARPTPQPPLLQRWPQARRPRAPVDRGVEKSTAEGVRASWVCLMPTIAPFARAAFAASPPSLCRRQQAIAHERETGYPDRSD